MKIQEFLEQLAHALKGELPQHEINTNIKYYDNYMRQQITSGKSEEEIIAALGDPRLIAKTIIDTFRLSNVAEKRYDSGNNYQEEMHNSYSSPEDEFDSRKKGFEKAYHVPLWAVKVIGIIVLILILSAFFWIGSVAIKLFFKIGIPLLLIYFTYRFVRENIIKK